MKKIMFCLLTCLFFTACSKRGESSKVSNPTQESYLSVIVGQEDEILLDLESVPYGKIKDGLIAIKQNQVALLEPSGLVDGKFVLDESSSHELTILSQSGCVSIKKTTGTCNIKIRANSQGLAEGSVLQGSILVHSENEVETRINITATVGDAPILEQTALVSSTSSSLSFGELSVNDKPKDLILTYKAIALLKTEDSLQVNIPAPFVLQSGSADSCSNKNISRNSSCTVKIRLDPKSVSSNGLISGNITFAGLSIPVSATITGYTGAPAASNLVWIYNNQEISELDLGTLLSSVVPEKFNLILKNKGLSNETVNVNLSINGFTIINRCQEKVLLPNTQCSLEVRPESTAGNKSVSLVVDGKPNLSLSVALNVIEQVITYQTIDTTASCSSLNLQVCDGTQNISKSYICEQYIDGIKNESYSGNGCQPLADMSPISCQSPSGNYVEQIIGGIYSYNCGAGVASSSLIPTVLCNLEYISDNIDLTCNEGVFPPELPTRRFGGAINLSSAIHDVIVAENGKFFLIGNMNGMFGDKNNKYMIKMNADFTVDKSFHAGGIGGTGFNQAVRDVAVLPDGKLMVVGDFSSFNGNTNIKYMVKLNSDGSHDDSFSLAGTGFNNIVYAIKYDELNDKFYVGGSFNSFSGVSARGFLRMNSNGTRDTSFALAGSGPSGSIYSIQLLDNGQIIIAGGFFQYDYEPLTSRGIVRINTDGTRDTSFNLGGDGNSGVATGIDKVKLLDDGKMLLSGSFTTFNGVNLDSRNYFIRVNQDLSLDTTFPGFGLNAKVNGMGVFDDDSIMMVGSFSGYDGRTGLMPILKINANGVKDISFINKISLTGGTVNSVLESYEGKVIVAGQLNSQDTSRKSIMSLNYDGSVDTSFEVQGAGIANGEVVTISQQFTTGGKIMVGGTFTAFNGDSARKYLVRLNKDGSLDTSFNVQGTGFGSVVYSSQSLPDGKLMVGGNFVSFNGDSTRRYLVRLNKDGTLDTSFNIQGTGFNSSVRSINVLPDGKIMVGGIFSSFNGDSTRKYLVRLNADGTLDTSFEVQGTGFAGVVYSLASQGDKILVGGGFSNFNGDSTRKRMLRLNADGSLDTSFNIQGTGFGESDSVRTIITLKNNKIVIGGTFVDIDGIRFSRIARLEEDGEFEIIE